MEATHPLPFEQAAGCTCATVHINRDGEYSHRVHADGCPYLAYKQAHDDQLAMDTMTGSWQRMSARARDEFLTWLGQHTVTPPVTGTSFERSVDAMVASLTTEQVSQIMIENSEMRDELEELRYQLEDGVTGDVTGRLCECGCGEPVTSPRPEARYATPACRVRAHRAARS